MASFGHNYIVALPRVTDQIERTLLPERTLAGLSGFVGGFSLALAAVGIYALLTYSVARRLREMALRLVLGASGDMLMRMIATEAMLLTAAGILAGILPAWAAASVSRSLMPDLPRSFLIPFVAATVVLVFSAVLAIARPALRAAHTEPAVALRLD